VTYDSTWGPSGSRPTATFNFHHQSSLHDLLKRCSYCIVNSSSIFQMDVLRHATQLGCLWISPNGCTKEFRGAGGLSEGVPRPLINAAAQASLRPSQVHILGEFISSHLCLHLSSLTFICSISSSLYSLISILIFTGGLDGGS
jgi:hypothetical protein